MKTNVIYVAKTSSVLLAVFAVVLRIVQFIVSRNTFLCHLITRDCSEFVNSLSEMWLQAHPLAVIVYPNMLAYFGVNREFYAIYEPGIGPQANISVASIAFDALCITETAMYGIVLGILLAIMRGMYQSELKK